MGGKLKLAPDCPMGKLDFRVISNTEFQSTTFVKYTYCYLKYCDSSGPNIFGLSYFFILISPKHQPNIKRIVCDIQTLMLHQRRNRSLCKILGHSPNWLLNSTVTTIKQTCLNYHVGAEQMQNGYRTIHGKWGSSITSFSRKFLPSSTTGRFTNFLIFFHVLIINRLRTGAYSQLTNFT